MIKRIVKVLLVLIAGLIGLLILFLVASMIRYSPEYVVRVLRWRESNLDTYRELFPARPVAAPSQPFLFDAATNEEDKVAESFASFLETPDLDEFMTEMGTQAFIVVHSGRQDSARTVLQWRLPSHLDNLFLGSPNP